jgi:hypothetical protein
MRAAYSSSNPSNPSGRWVSGNGPQRDSQASTPLRTRSIRARRDAGSGMVAPLTGRLQDEGRTRAPPRLPRDEVYPLARRDASARRSLLSGRNFWPAVSRKVAEFFRRKRVGFVPGPPPADLEPPANPGCCRHFDVNGWTFCSGLSCGSHAPQLRPMHDRYTSCGLGHARTPLGYSSRPAGPALCTTLHPNARG